jgi:hypothetical protein
MKQSGFLLLGSSTWATSIAWCCSYGSYAAAKYAQKSRRCCHAMPSHHACRPAVAHSTCSILAVLCPVRYGTAKCSIGSIPFNPTAVDVKHMPSQPHDSIVTTGLSIHPSKRCHAFIVGPSSTSLKRRLLLQQPYQHRPLLLARLRDVIRTVRRTIHACASTQRTCLHQHAQYATAQPTLLSTRMHQA